VSRMERDATDNDNADGAADADANLVDWGNNSLGRQGLAVERNDIARLALWHRFATGVSAEVVSSICARLRDNPTQKQ